MRRETVDIWLGIVGVLLTGGVLIWAVETGVRMARREREQMRRASRKRVVIPDRVMTAHPWPSYRGPLLGTGALQHEFCCLERVNDPRVNGAVFEWWDH